LDALRSVIAASRNGKAERHDRAQQKPTNPNILTSHDCHPISPPGIRGAEFLHFSAEIKGLSLKNAFNNSAALALSNARKICAVKRIVRLVFASSAEIMRKPSDCWSCRAIAVPNQRWFRDRRMSINARAGRADARTVDQGTHRAHLLSAGALADQHGSVDAVTDTI
jgi:hypothetical protein